jgi:fibrinogen gamma chain
MAQENNRLIVELEGQAVTLEGQAQGIQGQIDALHQFCKIGKQCAKQCFFGPELFGGIQKTCADYYTNSYWQSADARAKEYYNLPQSGIYIIQPHRNLTPKYVYCDQKTDGGGWTVLQHNGVSRPDLWEKYTNDSMKYRTNWAQNWNNYKHGFGHIMCNGEADFWIGNDYMHYMTHPRKNGGKMQLGRIDINDWDVDENGNGGEYWGYYDKFIVQAESRNYQLVAKNFRGVGSYSIGNAFAGVAFEGEDKHAAYTKQDGAYFSTKGEWKNGVEGGEWIHDNDKLCKPLGMKTVYGVKVPDWTDDDVAAQCNNVLDFDYNNWTKNMAKWGSCAQQDGAGFWYNRCSAGNLNGKVYRNGYYELKTIRIQHSDGVREMMKNNHDDGLIWTTLHNKGKDYSFMMAEIRIRPQDFTPFPMEGSSKTKRNGGQPDPDRVNANQ